jgi:hypothetical protein
VRLYDGSTLTSDLKMIGLRHAEISITNSNEIWAANDYQVTIYTISTSLLTIHSNQHFSSNVVGLRATQALTLCAFASDLTGEPSIIHLTNLNSFSSFHLSMSSEIPLAIELITILSSNEYLIYSA